MSYTITLFYEQDSSSGVYKYRIDSSIKLAHVATKKGYHMNTSNPITAKYDPSTNLYQYWFDSHMPPDQIVGFKAKGNDELIHVFHRVRKMTDENYVEGLENAVIDLLGESNDQKDRLNEENKAFKAMMNQPVQAPPPAAVSFYSMVSDLPKEYRLRTMMAFRDLYLTLPRNLPTVEEELKVAEAFIQTIQLS